MKPWSELYYKQNENLLNVKKARRRDTEAWRKMVLYWKNAL